MQFLRYIILIIPALMFVMCSPKQQPSTTEIRAEESVSAERSVQEQMQQHYDSVYNREGRLAEVSAEFDLDFAALNERYGAPVYADTRTYRNSYVYADSGETMQNGEAYRIHDWKPYRELYADQDWATAFDCMWEVNDSNILEVLYFVDGNGCLYPADADYYKKDSKWVLKVGTLE